MKGDWFIDMYSSDALQVRLIHILSEPIAKVIDVYTYRVYTQTSDPKKWPPFFEGPDSIAASDLYTLKYAQANENDFRRLIAALFAHGDTL